MNHHEEGKQCPLCDEKIRTAHPYMQSWFTAKKLKYENLHVYYAWRNQLDQDRFFDQKRTTKRWPNSPHNHMQGNIPCSLALDVFILNEDGEAVFPVPFYKKLNEENESDRLYIFWGGNFKHLGDYNHFEYRLPIKQG